MFLCERALSVTKADMQCSLAAWIFRPMQLIREALHCHYVPSQCFALGGWMETKWYMWNSADAMSVMKSMYLSRALGPPRRFPNPNHRASTSGSISQVHPLSPVLRVGASWINANYSQSLALTLSYPSLPSSPSPSTPPGMTLPHHTTQSTTFRTACTHGHDLRPALGR